MARHRAPQEAPFRVLYVCTGNICRSPFAEIFTRHVLVGRLGGRGAAEAFDIASAGVRAVVGSGMQEDSREELRPWGLHEAAAGRFVARQLRSQMVRESDLVLGATPRHRSSVVDRAPEALPYAFSVREFARLVTAVDVGRLPQEPAERARATVELARAQRGLVPESPEGDAITDPMGRPPEAHHAAATAIREAVMTIVDVLVPAGTPTRPLHVVRARSSA